MNMNLLAVVPPPSIYNGCSTQKTFWEENFTPGEFIPVNMKKVGLRNVRKHRDIKNCDSYITLDISLRLDSLDRMKIESSEPKDNYWRSGKGFITSLSLETIVRLKKKKKASYAINNVSMKDFSKIIKEFKSFLIRVMCKR